MAVTLNYVDMSEFSDVMTEEEQAQATDDSYGGGGTISSDGPTRDEQMVERFLGRAESRVDMYLIHYERPLDPVPEIVKYTVMVIARYMLDARGDGAVSENVQKSRDQAIMWLEDLRDGKIDLGGDLEEQGEAYFGDREGGTFGEYPFSDKSTFATRSPY